MKKNDELELAGYMDDLAEEMVAKASDLGEDKPPICAVLFYDEAKTLLKCLCEEEGTEIEAVELEPSDYNAYSDEYLICVDENLKIDVEPEFITPCEYHKDGIYKMFEASCLYIDESAKCDEILERANVDGDVITIEFDDEDDEPETEAEADDNNEDDLTDEECKEIAKAFVGLLSAFISL